MQSGLFNYTASPEFQKAMFADPRRPFTPHELLDFAFAQPNKFPPGEGFEYHILALAIALAVMIGGGGKASIDQAIAGTSRR